MKFNTALEYIEWLDSQSGENWSDDTETLAQVMEDYAAMKCGKLTPTKKLCDITEEEVITICSLLGEPFLRFTTNKDNNWEGLALP